MDLTKRDREIVFQALKHHAECWLKERHRLINGQTMWTSKRDEEHYFEICATMKKVVMMRGKDEVKDEIPTQSLPP